MRLSHSQTGLGMTFDRAAGGRCGFPRFPLTPSNPARNRCHVVSRVSGSTRVSAITVMKLESPSQRGSACMCRCAAIPAPAAWPRFSPMLIPSGVYTWRRTASVRCASVIISRAAARVQAGQGLLVGIRHDHDVAGRVGESIQADKAMLRPQHDIGCTVRLHRGAPLLDREPGGGNQVTKDAVTVTGPGSQRLGHAFAPACRIGIDQVSVTPGRPQVVHAVQVYGALQHGQSAPSP